MLTQGQPTINSKHMSLLNSIPHFSLLHCCFPSPKTGYFPQLPSLLLQKPSRLSASSLSDIICAKTLPGTTSLLQPTWHHICYFFQCQVKRALFVVLLKTSLTFRGLIGLTRGLSSTLGQLFFVSGLSLFRLPFNVFFNAILN